MPGRPGSLPGSGCGLLSAGGIVVCLLWYPAGQRRDRLACRGGALPPQGGHQGAVGQLNWAAVVGVAVAQGDLPGTQVGGFQVGGNAGLVERRVVGAQQRGAGALALPLWADSEDGQVMVGDAGRVVPVERCVEGQEPAGPGTCRDGEPCFIIQWLGRPVLAYGDPQLGCGAGRGGGGHAAGPWG